MIQQTPTEPLSELCEFKNGLWKGKKPPYVNVGIIRNTNFNSDGTLDASEIAFHDVEIKQLKTRRLEFGDIILEKSGGGPKQPVGRVITFEKQEGEYSFSNFTSLIRIRDQNKLDFRFLHRVLYWYYVSGVTETMQRRSTGIRNLDFNAYKRLEIPVPPLPEQRRIVGILDEAFDGIATAKSNAEKNLQNAGALFESYLDAVFARNEDECLEKPLGDVVEEISTGPFGSLLHKSDYEPGGIPLVNPINIVESKIVPDDRKAVGQETAERLSRYSLKEDDIVIGRRGEIGRCAVVEKEQAGWLCGTGSFIIRPNGTTNPFYLAHLLRSQHYRQKLERVAGRATMPSISNRDLANLVVRIPSLNRQDHVLSGLDDISAQTRQLESIYQHKLAVLDELKKSLLHQAFSGQL